MSPALLSERIVTARIAWVREMTARIRALPLGRRGRDGLGDLQI